MKKILIILALAAATQNIYTESIFPSFDFNSVEIEKNETWISKSELYKYNLEFKQDLKGYYLINTETNKKFRMNDFNNSFVGEKEFEGIRIRIEFVDLLFNLDDLKSKGLIEQEGLKHEEN